MSITQRLFDDLQHLGGENVLQRGIAELKGEVLHERQLDAVSALGVVLPTPLDVRPVQDDESERFFARRAPLGANFRLALLVVSSECANAWAQLEMDIVLASARSLGGGRWRHEPRP